VQSGCLAQIDDPGGTIPGAHDATCGLRHATAQVLQGPL